MIIQYNISSVVKYIFMTFFTVISDQLQIDAKNAILHPIIFTFSL